MVAPARFGRPCASPRAGVGEREERGGGRGWGVPSVEEAGIRIRPYTAEDAAATRELFRRAIEVTAASRYTAEQRAAWLERTPDVRVWNDDRLRVRTVVAELDGLVAGFSDLDAHGYIDRLFVDPAAGRRGVGGALLAHLVGVAAAAGIPELTTHASLVARPVFERAGFSVVEREVVRRGDVSLERFLMQRMLR